VKVLHFYRTYFPDTQGGGEEAIRQICLGTRACGVESRVLTLSPNPEPAVLQLPEAEVIRTKLHLDIASCSMSLGSFSAFRRLADWADLIHFHFPWPFADLVKLVTRNDTPSLVTYHSDIVRQQRLNRMYAPLMKTFLDSVSSIVATSPNYAATSPVLRNYAEKVEVIPLGIDENSYPRIDAAVLQRVRAQYGEDFLLFIGVLRHYKGLHILLEALQGASYPVVIVGSGPVEADLKRQAQALGIRNLHFAGYVPDQEKLALLRLARALVFPSHLRSEAFGVSLLEGAMMARPLISTEIGTGTSFVNIDGDTGFVVPPANARALRAAMDKLYADTEATKRMGNNARRRYESHFTAAGMGRAYADLYGRIARASLGKSTDISLSDTV